ncbi:MAG: hypothetical protein LC121_23505 [Anaerolineae bacterium]|nr:hypothetical protein [Anaerolineae bacterium]
MRRLRPISRRRRERAAELQLDESFEPAAHDEWDDRGALAAEEDLRPFVPVESASPDAYVGTPPEPDEDYRAEIGQAPRPPRSAPDTLRPGINPGALLLVLLLVVAGIIGTLLNLDRLDLDVPGEWPAALIVVAILWLVLALSRRRVTAALGAAMLAGVGVSALLDTQGVATWRDTMLGAVLIALGLGLVIRGLLLRQRAPA